MNWAGIKFLVFLVALWGLSGCVTSKQQTENAQLLTPEHFKRTAIIEEGDSEATAIITTRNGFRRKQGLLHFVFDDNFLRAFIDKKTEEVTYQVYQSIYYQASDWRFYLKANYESSDGPESVVAKFVRAPLAHDLNCPDHTSSVCAYNEHVGFPVYRELLDSIVSTYDPSKSDEWKFRFIPRIGDDYHDGLLVAEIVGFLEAVDSYKETYL
ncbi:MAG: hypothetical protein HOA81_02100 [Opitutales bacterium]|nr:hypothetical protein [Opitutales bacterium]